MFPWVGYHWPDGVMYKMEQGERLALYTYLFCGLRYDSHRVCWVGCWVHHLGGRWRLLRQLDIGGRLAGKAPPKY